MKLQIFLIASLFLAITVGQAEAENKGQDVPAAAKEEKAVEPAKVASSESDNSGKCLASEEIIKDIEEREESVKQKETAISEREKDVEAQKIALKEEVAKLEAMRAEIQGVRGKEIAANEEKINKLIETFETMSPKAAAAVLAKVDEELAVTTLSRLSNVKAGKILSQLDPVKSSKLSEMIAFGPNKKGKEKTSNGESNQRAPAAAKQ